MPMATLRDLPRSACLSSPTTSGGQRHPVAALWRVDLREELRDALVSGVRKIQFWTGRYPIAVATWAIEPVDPFFNVNTSDDLAEAKRLAMLLEC